MKWTKIGNELVSGHCHIRNMSEYRTVNGKDWWAQNQQNHKDAPWAVIYVDEDGFELVDDFHLYSIEDAKVAAEYVEENHFFINDTYDTTPSCTAGDYSPSCPWNAPGMSIHDFI